MLPVPTLSEVGLPEPEHRGGVHPRGHQMRWISEWRVRTRQLRKQLHITSWRAGLHSEMRRLAQPPQLRFTSGRGRSRVVWHFIERFPGNLNFIK